MAGRDIIVVGASTGGVEALSTLVAGLPEDFPAAVFSVIHFPPQARSVLPRILSKAGLLPAKHAVDGEPIRSGQIFVARPDYHLMLEWERVRVVHGPRENRCRPAVDPLFRSAARAYGPRVIGVVLTGALDDGTAGLLAVKSQGGVAVVQDPEDALVPGMPSSALRYVDVDHCLPLSEIPALLSKVVREQVEEGARTVPSEMEAEVRSAELDPDAVGD